ncbi:MAG: hypothetical protein IPM39_23795 [Chloroflexi bacterium]|nr:hypothetical protein [Chloroflexota bacterium]
MTTVKIRKKQILEALENLNESRWEEVLDFIGYLQTRPITSTLPVLADDLLHSELIGVWEEREDIQDSLTFARDLRRQAEHRNYPGHAAT